LGRAGIGDSFRGRSEKGYSENSRLPMSLGEANSASPNQESNRGRKRVLHDVL